MYQDLCFLLHTLTCTDTGKCFVMAIRNIYGTIACNVRSFHEYYIRRKELHD